MDNYGAYTRLIIHYKPILKLNNMKIVLLFYWKELFNQ